MVKSVAAGKIRKMSRLAMSAPIPGPAMNARFSGRYANVMTLARAASVADEVASWRRRLAGRPAAGTPALTRHGEVARVVTDVGALLLPARDEVMLGFMRQFGEWEKEESDLLILVGPSQDVHINGSYLASLVAATPHPYVALGAAGDGRAVHISGRPEEDAESDDAVQHIVMTVRVGGS